MQTLFKNQKPEILLTLKQSAIVESIESSNRLEGIVAEKSAISGIALRNADPKNRNESEIAGYKRALDLIHECSQDMPISVNDILQLHSSIYSFLPNEGGSWKAVDNEIVERDSSGSIISTRFNPVSAVETSPAMDQLIASYESLTHNLGIEPLLVIPLFILDYLCIHPFGDGNGRTARLLTLLLLYKHGYEVGRYISFERIIEDTKDSYYSTLHKASQGWHEGNHDALPWVEYMWGVLISAHKEYVSKIEVLERSPTKNKTERIEIIINELPELFSLKDVLDKAPDISREMVKKVVNRYKANGRLISEGAGRSSKLRKKLKVR